MIKGSNRLIRIKNPSTHQMNPTFLLMMGQQLIQFRRTVSNSAGTSCLIFSLSLGLHSNQQQARQISTFTRELVLHSIEDNQYFEHEGNLYIQGSIGKNAIVVVKNGSLTVEGNLCEGASVTHTSTHKPNTVPSAAVSFWFFSTSSSTRGPNNDYVVRVQGTIERGVAVKSERANILVLGAIGSEVKLSTQKGTIDVTDVGASCFFETQVGDIKTRDLGERCTLRTIGGDLDARDVSERTVLQTKNGDISVRSAHESVSFETDYGDIQEGSYYRGKTARFTK